MTANARLALGQIGIDLEVGAHGGVYRKWWDLSFTRQHTRQQLDPYWEELQLLITALDEFHAGRTIEVGDILASRLRMLTVGLDKGTWDIARRFLVYQNQDISLVPDEMMDEAMRIDNLEKKREKALAGARTGPAKR